MSKIITRQVFFYLILLDFNAHLTKTPSKIILSGNLRAAFLEQANAK